MDEAYDDLETSDVNPLNEFLPNDEQTDEDNDSNFC